MRIGIDARFIGPEGTGLGVYTQNLIENLAHIDKKNHYSIFLRESNWQHLKIASKNFTKVLADIAWYSFEEQIKMPAIFKSTNLDILHVPHFNVPILYRGRFVVTIHDLIHRHLPDNSVSTKNPLVFKLKRFGFHKVLNHAIRKSSKIITPSNFVKEDIAKNFKVDPQKIVVTYEAAEEDYFLVKRLTINPLRPRLASTLARSEASDQGLTLLYVGNAYPHKNLNRLLDALKILITHHSLVPSTSVALSVNEAEGSLITKLILVCPRDVFAKRLEYEIRVRNLTDIVELKGYLKAPDLKKLFTKSSAYIFPSLSEGFGIPGINAMALGLPVICSDIPTFKEVYGDAALYFDPGDSRDIAKKTEKVFKDKKLREDLIKRGQEQVKKYSWHKMATQTLKIYQEASKS